MMTEIEAIRELHNIRPRGSIIPQKRAEALDVAIKALEKQIPKKPSEMQPANKLTNGYYGCPICKNVVGIDDIQDDYCPTCGQKLDWE